MSTSGEEISNPETGTGDLPAVTTDSHGTKGRGVGETAPGSPETGTGDLPAVASGSIWTARFPAQKCTARKGDGAACRAWAITGGNVCVYHGGKAKQVREAARRRIESLVPEAIEVLADLAQGSAKDPATGGHVEVPPAVRARAAADILSRAGFAARAEHEIVLAEGPPRPDLDAAISRALDARGMLPGGVLALDAGESGGDLAA